MDNRLVIVNADIVTMDAGDRRCRSLAIENGRIVPVDWLKIVFKYKSAPPHTYWT